PLRPLRPDRRRPPPRGHGPWRSLRLPLAREELSKGIASRARPLGGARPTAARNARREGSFEAPSRQGDTVIVTGGARKRRATVEAEGESRSGHEVTRSRTAPHRGLDRGDAQRQGDLMESRPEEQPRPGEPPPGSPWDDPIAEAPLAFVD